MVRKFLTPSFLAKFHDDTESSALLYTVNSQVS